MKVLLDGELPGFSNGYPYARLSASVRMTAKSKQGMNQEWAAKGAKKYFVRTGGAPLTEFYRRFPDLKDKLKKRIPGFVPPDAAAFPEPPRIEGSGSRPTVEPQDSGGASRRGGLHRDLPQHRRLTGISESDRALRQPGRPLPQ
jgi:hypothetical protein